MDAWQQSVEQRVGEIRSDVRDQRNWLAGGAGFLLVAFAAGFMALLIRMDDGFDKTDARLDGIATAVAKIEASQAAR